MSGLIAHIPDHILHQPCTDRDQFMRILMVDVSRKTNVSFKMLGRYLNVDEPDLNAIEEENTGYHSAQERKYQVLLKWVNTHGENATVESLICALASGEDRQTVQFVCDKVAPREDVTRGVPGDLSYIANTPHNSGPIKTLPSPFGSTTPSSSTSVTSTPARAPSTPSNLLYQPPQAESLPHSAGKVTLNSLLMAAAGTVAQPSSTPADAITLPKDPYGPAISNMSTEDHSSDFTSSQGAVTSSASEMADLGVMRPGGERPSTLPVRPSHVPFGVQATREDPTPFDNMPKCCHGIGQWLQQEMENEIRKSYSQIALFSSEWASLQNQMDTLTLENKFYKENSRMQQDKIRQLAIGSCHAENSKLRTEVELHERLLSLICQSLQVSKQDILKACNVEKMSAELGMMIKSPSDQSHEVRKSVLSLRLECTRLEQEKLELEGKLDDFISLFAKKQQELETAMQEKKELVSLSEENETALRKLQEEVYSNRKFWQVKNKELEDRVATLESLNKDLMAENRELLRQNEELKESRLNVVPSKEVLVLSSFGRSLSDGSYRLASLENRVSYHTGNSLDESLAKHGCKEDCGPPCEEQTSQSDTEYRLESEFEKCTHKQVMENMVLLVTGIENGRGKLSAKAQELQEKIDRMKAEN